MIFLQALWARIWPYIAFVAAAFAAFFGIRQAGKAAGRAEAESEQQQAVAEKRGKAREVDEKLDQMGDSDIRDRAKSWVRDD